MSDSLIVAAEGSAPYKLLEDAGRGILTAEALTSALKNGVPAATCDDSSESLLTKCARACDIECVKLLLAKSAPVDAVDKRGVPALFVAMEYTAQILGTRSGCRNFASLTRSTARPLAAHHRYGRKEVIELLLEHRASTELRTAAGWNAVHWSVYNSHPIALELLLRKLSADTKKELVDEADPHPSSHRGVPGPAVDGEGAPQGGREHQGRGRAQEYAGAPRDEDGPRRQRRAHRRGRRQAEAWPPRLGLHAVRRATALPAAAPPCEAASECMCIARLRKPHLNYEPSATPAAVEAK